MQGQVALFSVKRAKDKPARGSKLGRGSAERGQTSTNWSETRIRLRVLVQDPRCVSGWQRIFAWGWFGAVLAGYTKSRALGTLVFLQWFSPLLHYDW